MVKTVLLGPSAVKTFNRVALKFTRVTEQAVICGIILRFATFALPANLGRILAPIAAIAHLPGMIVFTAGFRTEYVKIIFHTFDFWFLYTTSTIWAVVFSIVLGIFALRSWWFAGEFYQRFTAGNLSTQHKVHHDHRSVGAGILHAAANVVVFGVR